jgi:hypothetical protein
MGVCPMQDKRMRIKKPKESFSVPKNDINETPCNGMNSTGDEASLNIVGDSIYQVLFGRLSAVANEIISEIELSDSD